MLYTEKTDLLVRFGKREAVALHGAKRRRGEGSAEDVGVRSGEVDPLSTLLWAEADGLPSEQLRPLDESFRHMNDSRHATSFPGRVKSACCEYKKLLVKVKKGADPTPQ